MGQDGTTANANSNHWFTRGAWSIVAARNSVPPEILFSGGENNEL